MTTKATMPKKTKPAKKASPAKKAKPAKKTTKKAVKKTVKPVKKTAKKTVKKTVKKATKTEKKNVKKTAKKVSKKVVKTVNKKPVAKKKIITPEIKTQDKYKIKFHIGGYGAENCVTSLNDTQIKYWKKKYKKDSYDAQQELKDHLWNYDYDSEIPETHFGKWYDQDSIVHAERAYYTEGTRLVINVFKNDQEIEEIEIDVTDDKIKKEFYDEFVINKKNDKGQAYLYTHSSDRGMYSYGEFELPEGQNFDVSKISLNIGRIIDDRFVWGIIYDGEYLDDEGCYDSTGKGFYAEIHFF